VKEAHSLYEEEALILFSLVFATDGDDDNEDDVDDVDSDDYSEDSYPFRPVQV